MKAVFRLIAALPCALCASGLCERALAGLEALGLAAPPAAAGALACGAALLTSGALAYARAPQLLAGVLALYRRAARLADERPLPELMMGMLGAAAGLAAALCISALMRGAGLLGAAVSAIACCALSAAGYALLSARWRELSWSAPPVRAGAARRLRGVPKVLDTSVLIDGRIFDICRTGFIEGPLVVPRFVLAELQRIADSADALKRSRGRRGLDMVARIQRELDIELIIDDTDFEGVDEVDVKLLKLTELLLGRVMTNDFNLNKVAAVSGIGVLNVNELAGALRPALLPGEELTVQIVREGREQGQGVAFMDDGTMIVVENGRRHIGKSVSVSVNTVLQTSAGRMIFARLRERAAG